MKRTSRTRLLASISLAAVAAAGGSIVMTEGAFAACVVTTGGALPGVAPFGTNEVDDIDCAPGAISGPIRGLDGGDTVTLDGTTFSPSGGGNDVVGGGEGDDTITVTNLSRTGGVSGDAGNDEILVAGSNVYRVLGGTGNDEIVVADDGTNVQTVRENVEGGNEDPTLAGAGDSITIFATDGLGVNINGIVIAGQGNDEVAFEGDGTTTISNTASQNGTVLPAPDGIGINLGAEVDGTGASVDDLGDDKLIFSGGPVILFDGTDLLSIAGGQGSDTVTFDSSAAPNSAVVYAENLNLANTMGATGTAGADDGAADFLVMTEGGLALGGNLITGGGDDVIRLTGTVLGAPTTIPAFPSLTLPTVPRTLGAGISAMIVEGDILLGAGSDILENSGTVTAANIDTDDGTPNGNDRITNTGNLTANTIFMKAGVDNYQHFGGQTKVNNFNLGSGEDELTITAGGFDSELTVLGGEGDHLKITGAGTVGDVGNLHTDFVDPTGVDGADVVEIGTGASMLAASINSGSGADTFIIDGTVTNSGATTTFRTTTDDDDNDVINIGSSGSLTTTRLETADGDDAVTNGGDLQVSTDVILDADGNVGEDVFTNRGSFSAAKLYTGAGDDDVFHQGGTFDLTEIDFAANDDLFEISADDVTITGNTLLGADSDDLVVKDGASASLQAILGDVPGVDDVDDGDDKVEVQAGSTLTATTIDLHNGADKILVDGTLTTTGATSTFRDAADGNDDIIIDDDGTFTTASIGTGAGLDDIDVEGSLVVNGDIDTGTGIDTITVHETASTLSAVNIQMDEGGDVFTNYGTVVLTGDLNTDKSGDDGADIVANHGDLQALRLFTDGANDVVTHEGTRLVLNEMDLAYGNDKLTIGTNGVDITTTKLGAGADTLTIKDGALADLGDVQADGQSVIGAANYSDGGIDVLVVTSGSTLKATGVNMGNADDIAVIDGAITEVTNFLMEDGNDEFTLGIDGTLPTTLVLDGGANDDTFKFINDAAATISSLKGGTGDDSFTIASSFTTSNFLGDDGIGGTGSDTMTVAQGATFSATTSFDFELGDDVLLNAGTFGAMGITANFGDGDDDFKNEASGKVLGDLNLGAGADEAYFAAGSEFSGTLEGGDGTDVYTIVGGLGTAFTGNITDTETTAADDVANLLGALQVDGNIAAERINIGLDALAIAAAPMSATAFSGATYEESFAPTPAIVTLVSGKTLEGHVHVNAEPNSIGSTFDMQGTIKGDITVDQGALMIANGGVQDTGKTTIAGTVLGTGTLHDVTIAATGILSPSDPSVSVADGGIENIPGAPFMISGSLDGTGTVRIDIDDVGNQTDQLVIGGTADLTGLTLDTDLEDGGNYANGGFNFQIVSDGTGAPITKFGTVLTELNGLSQVVDGNKLNIVALPTDYNVFAGKNGQSCNDAALTDYLNQVAASPASANNQLLLALNGLAGGTGQPGYEAAVSEALHQLNPELFDAYRQIGAETNRDLADHIAERRRAKPRVQTGTPGTTIVNNTTDTVTNSGGTDGATTAFDGSSRGWLGFDGSYDNYRPDCDAQTYDHMAYGLVGGASVNIGQSGASFDVVGLGKMGNLDWDDRAASASADTTSYGVGLFGSHKGKIHSVSLGASVSMNQFDATRGIRIGEATNLNPFTGTATSDHDQMTMGVHADLSLELNIPETNAYLTPYVRFDGTYTGGDTFTETGSAAGNMTIEIADSSLLNTEMGLIYDHAFGPSDDVTFAPQLGIGMFGRVNADGGDITATFEGETDKFTVDSRAGNDMGVLLQVGFESNIAQSVGFYGNYKGEIGTEGQKHAGSAGIRVKF